jgi:hypothetical protein
MLPVVEQVRTPAQVLVAFVRRGQVLVHERDDPLDEIGQGTHGERHLVVVVRLATRRSVDRATPEEVAQMLAHRPVDPSEADSKQEASAPRRGERAFPCDEAREERGG